MITSFEVVADSPVRGATPLILALSCLSWEDS